MAGPRRTTRAPVASSYGSTRVIRGKIISVDKVKHTVTVQGENNEIFEGIQFMPKYINADGTGSFLTPETNSIVWLCTPSSDSTPFILGSSALPQQSEDETVDPNDYRMNRPVLNEGDEMVASRDTSYIIVRKGGMIEVASTQMARTFWIPIENLIQSFCENYTIDTPGGSFSMLCRDEDETWGADKTPMEFQLTVKEFCNDEFDIFDLRVGRIAAEDDTYIPIAGSLGQIVARLVINRHFTINIDKDGNCLKSMQGTDIESIEGSKFSTVQKTFQQVVKGLYSHTGKDRNVELQGYDKLRVGTDQSVTVTGSVSYEIGGAETKTVTGKVTETTGEIVRSVQGAVNETISGPANENVGGTKVLGAGENLQLNAAGKVSVKAANAQWPLESTGLEIVLTNGELQIVDQLGTIILAAGGFADVAAGRIVIKPTGSIIIQNALGITSEFELNATGVRMKTAAGDVTLDAKGSVHLGTLGLGGGVVTTQTHPFDYITGMPILGVSTVTATGIPAPGPVGIPAVFMPDDT